MSKHSSHSCKGCDTVPDSITLEGTQYSNRHHAEKTATNNQWASANQLSTEGTQYSNRHHAEKTATNNQWTSRNMPDERK